MKSKSVSKASFLMAIMATLSMIGCGDSGDGTGSPDDPVCGDALVEGTEACDDGNTTDGDGCSALCDSDESCGNGVVDASEVCDDGNTADADGCSAACDSDESCGNGIVELNERCDDASDTLGAHCGDSCMACDWDVAALTFPIDVTSGNGFGDLVFDTDCNLLVGGGFNDAVNLITPAGAVSTFASGYISGTPLGYAYDLATSTLYVAANSPFELWAIDSLGAATKVMDLPGIMNDIEFAPAGFGTNGGDLFGVANDGKVYLIDLTTPGTSEFASTTGTLNGMAFAPDGSALYISNHSGDKVEVVDAMGVIADFYPGLDNAEGVAMDPSGARLVVAYQSSGDHIAEISIPGGVLVDVGVPSIDGGYYPTGLVMDADGDVFAKVRGAMSASGAVETFAF